MIKKISFNLLLVLGLSSPAWAADSTSTNASPQTTNTQNNAIEFARQAGSIAGVTQACGQNVSEFNQRIVEAINQLTTNPADKAGAMLVYQQIAREAQANEQKTQTIPCTKALEDYANLPIMQADYKEKVIAQLNAAKP
ncbi:hypothetical protein [Rickettsiella endosymbiont of Dermanyssus gallinae]|uniref:hypothetical protein n=1 Tax=Rickettsiella endosymbiont of Dermanyssus gallinae TaxID=2856608 RepID=UPI001C52E3A0|nr:hypothetical protein [Rickettsiella endosymbiont of Dermanyssus gallinae]